MTIEVRYEIGTKVRLVDGHKGTICGYFVGLDEYGSIRVKYRIYLGDKTWTSVYEKEIMSVGKF